MTSLFKSGALVLSAPFFVFSGGLVLAQSGREGFSDPRLASAAASSGMLAILLGQLAVQKSSNKSMKRFARRMMADQMRAGAGLKKIASGQMTLPSGLTPQDRVIYDSFSRLEGADFDRAYMEHLQAPRATTEAVGV